MPRAKESGTGVVESTTPAAPEWRLVGSFRHRDGLTYSQGSALPSDLTPEELEALYQRRVIAKRAAGGVYESAAPPVPTTAEEYLRASDVMVLRRIRKYRPPAEVVREILHQVEEHPRGTGNPVFLEGLRLAAGAPLREDEPVE